MKTGYLVTWGYGYTQKVPSKTEAIKIASSLLNDYDNVTIQKL